MFVSRAKIAAISAKSANICKICQIYEALNLVFVILPILVRSFPEYLKKMLEYAKW